jgi:OFA family oxalate/formate antiporter-like MFS transporter
VKRSRAKNGRFFYGWVVVGATFLILFAAFGVVYSFGAFFLALSTEFGAPRAAVSAVFSYAVFTLFITGAVSGVLADRVGPKKVMLVGVFAIIAGLLSAAGANDLWQVSLSFTCGVGAGVGFVYIPAISTVQRWFVQRRGLASGFAVTGIGVGTFVMPILAGILLETMSWRTVFELMAVIVAVAGVIAVALIEGDPATHGLQADGHVRNVEQTLASTENTQLKPLVLSPRFVQMYASQAILSISIFVPFVHLVPFAQDIDISRSMAVGVLGMIGIGSTAGRFIIGAFADGFGRQRTLALLLAGIGASYGIWLFADGIVALSLFAVCFGICYGGYVALIPALLADYFAGPKLSSVIGLQYTASAAGSLVGPILAGYLFDVSGVYTGALVVSAGCAFVACYLVVTMPEGGGTGTAQF